MQELETIQPEESREGSDAGEAVESTEAVEEQALDDATHEPGARVEEEQSFEQAEAVEGALTDAMASVETVEAPPPEEESPPESDTDPEDLPAGSGVLVVPHETAEMAEPLEKPGPADVAEVPEGIEFQLAEEEDDSPEPDEFYVDETGILLGEEEAPGREAREIDPDPIIEEAGEIEPVSPEEVLESMSEEQKAVLNSLDPKDQEDLLRVIANSQRILPDQMPGDGNIIY